MEFILPLRLITLRKFRDNYLSKHKLGREFIEAYYKYSPAVAEYIEDKPILKRVVRLVLKPIVWVVNKAVEK